MNYRHHFFIAHFLTLSLQAGDFSVGDWRRLPSDEQRIQYIRSATARAFDELPHLFHEEFPNFQECLSEYHSQVLFGHRIFCRAAADLGELVINDDKQNFERFFNHTRLNIVADSARYADLGVYKPVYAHIGYYFMQTHERAPALAAALYGTEAADNKRLLTILMALRLPEMSISRELHEAYEYFRARMHFYEDRNRR